MTVLLFMSSVLLWGSAAYVTTLQVGPVPVPVSVGYRMLLMAAAMLLVIAVTRGKVRVDRGSIPWIAAHAATFFSMNFICFYYATHFIPSGVATLALSTSPIVATIFAFFVLGDPIRAKAVLGMLLGAGGLAIIVAPDLADLSGGRDMIVGMSWAIGASVSTAIGTIIGARNQQNGLSPYTSSFWCGLISAALCMCIALGAGMPITIDPSVRYLGSLAYLALVASCGAFLVFFALVARLGPGRSSYVFTVVPVVALLVSAGLEGVVLGPAMLAGTALIIGGNVLVLRR